MRTDFIRRTLTTAFCSGWMVLTASHALRAQAPVSVLAFGAVADGVMRKDGAMSPNSPVLTSPSGSFTAADQGKYIQVIGAGPGGTARTDGVIAAGSAVLTSGSSGFVSSDVGRCIVVSGAGAGGGNLVGRIQSFNSPSSVTLSVSAQTGVAGVFFNYGGMTLEATIQSVQSSSAVTLSAPASALTGSATYAYGTDNHAAFQRAVDTVGISGGGQVSVPAPAACAAGAVCGYVVKASDQQTAQAPGAIKIRYSNVSLVGDAPQTNLFCRGAFGTYTNTVAFPNTTGNIRGFCLNIGDNGGANGAAGEAVSNVTVSQLHLYGMTNGNTFNVNFAYPPTTPTGDGWDVTHKAIYMWDNSAFSNIVINSVIIQDFKAENIYSGGSVVTGMMIRNSTMTNFNGNGISMLAASLQVLNNTISNGSNAAVENSTVSMGSQALVSQLYQGNTISLIPREGIVVVGVDNGVAAGTVQILNNTFDTIAQINPSGTESAIYIASQNNYIPPANVTVTGNTCHDCQTFGVFQTSGNTVIQGNNFIVDRYNAGSVFGFTNALNGVTIANNTGSSTAQAQASHFNVGAVYVLNPGYASGSFQWKNVVIKGNSWTFPGAPQYQFVTTSGPGWNLLTQDNLRWQGDTCSGCTHADVNHGLVDLSATTTIRPYGPVVYVNGNASAVNATVDASKEEDGSQVQIVNAGTSPVSFSSDNNLSLNSPYSLQPGNSANLVYSAAAGRFTLASAPASVSATAGTPQSVTVNKTFSTALQATVTDSGNNPVSGIAVTFAAPSGGASATFSGAGSTVAVTGANGVATAPALTANGQAGAYVVTASAAGAGTSASYALTNTSAVGNGNGALAGTGTSSAATVNLTAEGSSDWVHWGDSTLTRKAGVAAQLSSYTPAGSGAVLTYSNDPRPVSWTDGTPLTSATGDTNGVYVVGTGLGFSFTAPADTTSRTLTVHAGGWFSAGAFTAHLSDGSAADFTDATALANGQYDRNYTLVYHAGAAAQTLNVSWVMTAGPAYGNVTLNAAALAGAAPPVVTITSTAGTPQSATIGTAFATALQATVKDTNNNPVSGAAVTFTAPAGGASGTFGGSATVTAITGTTGIATAPTLTANSQTGSYSVVATVPNGASGATFSLTNTAPLTISVSATGGTPQSATAGTAFATPLTATVTNSANAPVAGAVVTFTAPAGGASGTFSGSTTATAVTGATGIATAPAFTANTQTGSYFVVATVPSATGSAAFILTNTAPLTISVSATAGTPQSATVGTAFGTPLQATVKNSANAPVAGATVTFTAPASGASGTFGGSATATAVTGATGIATAPTFTANSQTGSYSVMATAAGATAGTTFSLTNNAATTPPGNGALTGAGTGSATPVNLTSEGTGDWVHWGDSGLNRKANVSPQLSSWTQVGTGSVVSYNNDPRPVNWTDGTPSTSAGNDTNGLYIPGTGQGFAFTAPADTTVRTLTVHVGGWFSGGTLTAHLSDNSAADFTDVTAIVNEQYDRNYTLTYHAASASQTIAVVWEMSSGTGNVTLNAAALAGSTVPVGPVKGFLNGSADGSSAAANLTTEGVTDWIHWGDGALNRKSGVTPVLTSYSVVGGGVVNGYSNDPRPIMWTDGAPAAVSTNNTDGVFINAIGNGFAFTAPADTTVRILTIHVGGWFSGGTLTAHLSDGSAADYRESTLPVSNSWDRNYTLTYNAASAGQTLTVSWVDTSAGGNVTLNSAALR